jgi:tetratricopeptide (TPR) repeat protein
LVVQGFSVPPETSAADGVARDAALEIKNVSSEPIRELRLTVEAAGARVLERELPPLAPSSSLSVKVPLANVAIGEDGYVALGATLTYLQGERRGLASAFASRVAATSPTAPAVIAPAAGGEYAHWMQVGASFASEGRWEQAHAAYARAHELHPSARTLQALGLVEFDLGQRESALRRLRAALTDSVQPLSAEQRHEVSTVLARLR